MSLFDWLGGKTATTSSHNVKKVINGGLLMYDRRDFCKDNRVMARFSTICPTDAINGNLEIKLQTELNLLSMCR